MLQAVRNEVQENETKGESQLKTRQVQEKGTEQKEELIDLIEKHGKK